MENIIDPSQTKAINPALSPEWSGEKDQHAERELRRCTRHIESMGMKMYMILIPGKRKNIIISPGTKWVGKSLTLDTKSTLKNVNLPFVKNVSGPFSMTPATQIEKPLNSEVQDWIKVKFSKNQMMNTLTAGFSDIITYLDPKKIKRNKAEINTIYTIYNEYLKRQYYTANRQYVPILGMFVANRVFEKDDKDKTAIKYKSVISEPISSNIADATQISSLDFLIKTVGGRDRAIETIHLPLKNILLKLNTSLGNTGMESVTSTRSIIISAENTSNANNPTSIDNSDSAFIREIKQHIASKKKVFCQLKYVGFPTKIKPDISMFIISVEGWTFNEVSYINGEPSRILGFVNLSKIKNFDVLRNDDVLHGVTFNSKNEWGTSSPIPVNDPDDLKSFEIEIRDQDNKIVKFSDGKYPLFILNFYFM